MEILDIIYPKKCLNCRKTGKYICINCIKKAKGFPSICVYCQKPTINGKTHNNCKKYCDLDGLISVFFYKGVIRKAILALKYKFAYQVAKELSKLITLYLKEKKINISSSALLVPIPLHKLRKNWRGFNQADEIGKTVAKNFNWKYTENLLIREKKRKPQTKLEIKKRKENIKGVFRFNEKLKIQKKKTIIIFDDVYTSGSTINEAAKTIKNNGNFKVWALTICR